ncbi:dipeptidase [Leucobacter allii]|uniref:dipeptidase n=1 Tax=Leucobacter allii TaxID=2932247 RepID=UPI001FD2EA82|nr:membrane dipeptidase [Leucobacter allii]UOR01532.1 dipeptidase [Leucobacter allii]
MSGTREFARAAGYDGYRSFSYLRPGGDYRDYEWETEIDRLPLYSDGLTPEQREHAERLLQESLVISLHDHPQVYPREMALGPEYASQGRTPVGYEGLAYSGLDVVFDNLAGPTGCIVSRFGWDWGDVVYDIGHRLADLAHQDFVRVVRSLGDIEELIGTGHIGMVLALEAASPIDNDIDRVDILHGFGVRQMGLVYNEANLLGGGLKEARDGGLSRFGHRVVERMNRLGMSIDLSHAGDRTTMDAIGASEAPVMITHAGARGVWPSERMKPDHVLRELASRGGLLGIEAAPNSTVVRDHGAHSIESVMAHFEYCVELMGIDHVTFGPDTLYGDHAKLHEAFAGVFGIGAAQEQAGPDPQSRVGVVDLPRESSAWCDGMENPTENFRNAIGWLVAHGYSDDDIRKVVGGNTMKVLARSW